MLTHTRDLLTGGWRYASGLRQFLETTVGIDEAKAVLTEQLQARARSFIQVLELGIYANVRSPYRHLLLHAGLEFDDVKALVETEGIEATLGRLYDSGVFVTLNEFKGRTPIRRPGLELEVIPRDFDNPLLTAHYEGRTGGSRSDGMRVQVDFDHIAYQTASTLIYAHANNWQNRPKVLMRPGPPSTTGLQSLFSQAKAGMTPEKWFSPSRPGWNRQALQGRALIAYTLLVARLSGRPLPGPEYQPDPKAIVRYLAEKVRQGNPAVIACGASESVRLCMAAAEMGANIAGTTLRGGGEPFTEGKAAVLSRVGAKGSTNYAMHEAGMIAQGCGAPEQPDDMHLMLDRMAVLQRPVRQESVEVQGLIHTSLLTSAPKLMLNVESGDYGCIEERGCGCLFERLGFTTHLHSVRSYEKLTSGGVMFMGSMLHQLLEETLPDRFGGSPLDYQLVEEEEGGRTHASLFVSPRLGPVDEQVMVDTIIDSLGFADWSRRQADLWRRNGTLRVRRREPYVTRAGKILPLHLTTSPDAGRQAGSQERVRT